MKPDKSNQPASPADLLNRGVMLLSISRFDEAEVLLRQAVDAAPKDAVARRHLAICLQRRKQLSAALEQIDAAAELRSDDFDVQLAYASILFDLGRDIDCLKRLRNLVKTHSEAADVWKLSSLAFTRIGRHTEALEANKIALQLAPNDLENLVQRAAALQAAGHLAEAMEGYLLILARYPADTRCHTNAGVISKMLGNRDAAMYHWTEALKLDAQHYEARMNRGLLHMDADRWDAAERDIELVLAHKPHDLEALIAHATIAHRMGSFAQARERYENLLKIYPGNSRGTWNLGLLELSLGNFARGWPMYEARQQQDEFRSTYSRDIPYSRLPSLEAAAGKRVLLLHEQGLGDSIQFSRYAKLIREHADEITVLAPKSLHRLLLSSQSIDKVVAEVKPDDEYDYFDYLMSLPRLTSSTDEMLKQLSTPYLFADQRLVSEWRARLHSIAGPRIGVVWQGGTLSKIKGRSIALESLLAMIPPGISIISLQKEIKDNERLIVANTDHLHHYGDLQADFADAAALIENVDLVISVDTSVAHLAAAVAKETWITLPFSADWRWMMNRSDSPWYPTARLFRQKTQGDWSGIAQEIYADLSSRFL